MIPVVDRVPTYPGRVKITKENGGQVEYVTWERADEPTEEGTPINKVLFDSIQADLGLSENVTIYVSGSGSDTLGDGSEANPYATINKALAIVPKNLNGYTATINIAAGTYPEAVQVSDFKSGKIVVAGASSAAVNIDSLAVRGSLVDVQLIHLTTTNKTLGIEVSKGGFLLSTTRIVASGANKGITVFDNGLMSLQEVTVLNAAVAIECGYCGNVYVNTMYGSGNTLGLAASQGGRICYGTDSLGATNKSTTSLGGRIYSGAQTSVPNY